MGSHPQERAFSFCALVWDIDLWRSLVLTDWRFHRFGLGQGYAYSSGGCDQHNRLSTGFFRPGAAFYCAGLPGSWYPLQPANLGDGRSGIPKDNAGKNVNQNLSCFLFSLVLQHCPGEFVGASQGGALQAVWGIRQAVPFGQQVTILAQRDDANCLEAALP